MGKLIQCDRCSKILNPEVDEYSVLTGSDHNYVEVGCAEDVKELHFCSDCIKWIRIRISPAKSYGFVDLLYLI